MSELKFVPQTDAEHDKYLLETFHKGDHINKLFTNRFSIITGRKGTGKTAIALYIRENHLDYSIDFADRLSLQNIRAYDDTEETVEIILSFILSRIVITLLEEDLISSQTKGFWEEYLKKNGFNLAHSFQSFEKTLRKRSPEISVEIPKIIKAGVNEEISFEKRSISDSVEFLFPELIKSIKKENNIVFFIDDMTDYLDKISSPDEMSKLLNLLQDLLQRLTHYNNIGNNFQLISCIRDDLFATMNGSNINKLRNNSLTLEWNEADYLWLLVKRLPHLNELDFDDISAVKTFVIDKFPNEIFTERLKSFNTKSYQTKLYAYTMATTFNRPRDYIKFCYSLRNRLSETRPVEFENIEAAEIEFSDYFLQELKDELSIISKIIGIKEDSETLIKLLKVLSKKQDFTFQEIKTELGRFLPGSFSNDDVIEFIKKLWFYGMIGFEGDSGYRVFKYFNEVKDLVIPEKGSDRKKRRYSLHRGLFWSFRHQKG